ncbi:MAG: DUF4126 domain-containing protein [Betaproteobacteria bacterium]
MTLDHQLTTIAIALALAWASGIRLYAVLFLVGMAGQFHWFGWQSPQSLAILSHPVVLGANALLLFIEFFADKIPAIDSIWDAIHTFIRIPAGALLAAGVVGADDGAAWALAAGLLGGTITAGTHFTKAGGRLAINASPEPVSNWVASFSEEAAVLGGLWLAFQHPVIFLLMLALFVLVMIWLIPKLYRFVRSMLRRISGWMTPERSTQAG